MIFEEYCEEILNKIKDDYPETEVKLSEQKKGTDSILMGLSIKSNEELISPIIYLNDSYEAYVNGSLGFDDIIKRLENEYEKSKVNMPVDVSFLNSFEKIKDKIKPVLINTELNQELLKEVPHNQYSDFAVVYRIFANFDEIGKGTVLIKEPQMAMWGVSLNDIHNAAIDNLKAEEHLILPWGKAIDYANNGFDFISPDFSEDWSQRWLLTDHKSFYGSRMLLDEEFLNTISKKIESGFYVVPISIHEVMIKKGELTIPLLNDLTSQIKSVNKNILKPEEILSNHAYYYDPTMKKLLTPDEAKQVCYKGEEMPAFKTM